MSVDLPIIVDDERIEVVVFKAMAFQECLPDIRLKRSELKMPLPIPVQDKIY